jgi:hypothetical protein
VDGTWRLPPASELQDPCACEANGARAKHVSACPSPLASRKPPRRAPQWSHPQATIPHHHNNLLEVHPMETLTKPALSAFEGGRK